MGLNDRKNVVANCIKEKKEIVKFLAKKNWDKICDVFNNPEENRSYVYGNDTAEIYIDFGFSYSGLINGKDTPLGMEELIDDMQKYFPDGYKYFAPLIDEGIISNEIEFVPTKLFRTGHAKFKVEKSPILCDIEKEIKTIAANEDVDLEIRYSKLIDFHYFPIVSKPFTENVYLADFKKESRTSKFAATLRVTRR